MNIQETGSRPIDDLVEQNAGQEKGVIQDRCRLILFCDKPTYLEDVLVEPHFKPAQGIEQPC